MRKRTGQEKERRVVQLSDEVSRQLADEVNEQD